MVLLRMLQGQITEKTRQLRETEQLTELRNAKDNAKLYCDELCTEVLANDCADVKMAQYCVAKIKDGIDLDGNKARTDYDTSLLGGIGVCEDTIYCPQIADCTCNTKLSMDNCHDILCDYWEDNAINTNATLKASITPGDCLEPNDYASKGEFWWNGYLAKYDVPSDANNIYCHYVS
jgi:hypothetical protein